MPTALRFLLAGGCAAAALAAPMAATGQPAAEAAPQVTIPSAPGDANPTTSTVTLTVPLRDAGRYLGDIIVAIEPDDRVRLPAARLIELLTPVLGESALADLARMPQPTTAGLAAAGVSLVYNPQELAVDLSVAAERRASRSLQVSPLEPNLVGEALRPATTSAYLNVRASADYLHGDGGFAGPVTFFDGAARMFGVTAEGEAAWQQGESSRRFARAGTRLIYDDRERLARWTAGDLQPLGRGFQSLPEIAGVSVFRSYGVLQPQRIARPRGDRSFALSRPSTVEVLVNGQLVRRLQLEPGNYDLRDFPFTQGSNDVRLAILDDAGRTQVLNFNVFLDQQQLGRGLTEFGLYAGLLSETGQRGMDYSDDPAMTGFVRSGISDRLTLGGNVQADRRTQMGGMEALWSSPLGTVGASVALSHLRDSRSGRDGLGHAAVLTFQRVDNAVAGSSGAGSFNAFVERRSRTFSVLGVRDPINPFKWEAGGGYSRSLSARLFAGVDGRYSRGRGVQPDIFSLRGTGGLYLSDRLNLAGEVRWEKDNFERRVSGLLTATMRLGRYSNLRADYDTRFDRARLSYSTFRGTGVGAYNLTADLDRSQDSSGVNATGNYFANRAELGFSHYGTFADTFGDSQAQRSTVRLGTALAYADGAVSVGRPIYDSFAVVRGHRSLRGASIEVERTLFGLIAETGALGSAVHPALPAYIDRTIAVDAPSAPATADLGQGTFRVFPAYRSGYRLTVGSGYNITAVGRLIGADGAPLALASGVARELAAKPREPVSLFTNRDGRFGLVGLAPGRWRIDIAGEATNSFILDIPRDAEGVIQVGELRLAGASE